MRAASDALYQTPLWLWTTCGWMALIRRARLEGRISDQRSCRSATCRRACCSSPRDKSPRNSSARMCCSNRDASKPRARSPRTRSSPPWWRFRTTWRTRVLSRVTAASQHGFVEFPQPAEVRASGKLRLHASEPVLSQPPSQTRIRHQQAQRVRQLGNAFRGHEQAVVAVGNHAGDTAHGGTDTRLRTRHRLDQDASHGLCPGRQHEDPAPTYMLRHLTAIDRRVHRDPRVSPDRLLHSSLVRKPAQDLQPPFGKIFADRLESGDAESQALQVIREAHEQRLGRLAEITKVADVYEIRKRSYDGLAQRREKWTKLVGIECLDPIGSLQDEAFEPDERPSPQTPQHRVADVGVVAPRGVVAVHLHDEDRASGARRAPADEPCLQRVVRHHRRELIAGAVFAHGGRRRTKQPDALTRFHAAAFAQHDHVESADANAARLRY